MNVLPALLLSLLLAAPAAQEPDSALARFRLDGEPAVVTCTDVALAMAFRLRHGDRGHDACDQLVDATLTRRAAERKGLMPTRAEVQAFWQQLQEQLRAAGQRPEDFAAVRNSGIEQWYADLAVQLAHERLVRAELDLGPREPVSPDMLKLWLQEERRRHDVVVDPEQLPPGACARIGDRELPLVDLGLLLLRISEDDERDRFVREIVFVRSLAALARREQVQLTEPDLDRAVQRRRDDVARDPRYQGVPLEQLLKAQGLTVARLRQLNTFRAQVLLDQVALQRFPDATLAHELADDRQRVLDLVGPRRHLGLIFLRALEQPNTLVPLDFPAAERRLQQIKQRLAQETFANVARIESEHEPTRGSGGDAGWFRRGSRELPEALLAAAWRLDADQVSEPVRSEEGVYLVKVFEIDPVPPDERLLEQLRAYKAIELSQQLLRDAQIEPVAAKDAIPR